MAEGRADLGWRLLSEMGRQITVRPKAGSAAGACNVSVALVRIDQAPIRDAVAADCTSAMARLERARIGWHKFERQDKPAFVRWRAREFGALLSTARDVEERIRESQILIHEVEMEMRRAIQDPYSAYQRVMFRRANPAAAAREVAGESDKPATARKLSEFEKETLFQDWVQKFLGTNPQKMDDDAYETTFEVFKSHMFGAGRTGASSLNGDLSSPARMCSKAHAIDDEDAVTGGQPEDRSGLDPRIKALYRRLVRRLHPDLRADGSASVSTLWHDVQEAYDASDVARMELLVALSDLQAKKPAEGTTLSEMHSVLTELNRSVAALEKSLLEAEEEDAWDFARTGPNDDVRLQVERQLETDLAGRTKRLDLLTSTIADWARGPIVNRKVRQIGHRTVAS